ncbi:MAG: FecR domain-containing protein [Rhodobacteraceae bacterium]|nr:FecR domain-containing protein [Paracoccaceae bacterium]
MNEQILDDALLDEATEWFVLMRAVDISAARTADFIRWISQSHQHQAAYAEIGGFWDGLPSVDKEIRPPTTVTSLADHKAAKSSNDMRKVSAWSPRTIAASIAFLLISVIGFTYGDTFLMDTHTTKVGELADIILEDGSHLVMNTKSKVRIDLQDDKRIVYLEEGEVYFDVRKDKNRPFYVETSGGLVRVLGTKFNIRQKGGASDVTVLEGSVGVVDYGRVKTSLADMSLDATLAPGQKFTLGNDDLANVAVPVDETAVLAWRDRKLIYNGESFASLVADINRYYDVEIRIGDPALRDIEVVAILDVADQAATLKALETTFNVTARPVSKDLIYLYPNK